MVYCTENYIQRYCFSPLSYRGKVFTLLSSIIGKLEDNFTSLTMAVAGLVEQRVKSDSLYRSGSMFCLFLGKASQVVEQQTWLLMLGEEGKQPRVSSFISFSMSYNVTQPGNYCWLLIFTNWTLKDEICPPEKTFYSLHRSL